MTGWEDSALPLELRINAMLRERVPHHKWDARRVVWAVRDFRDLIDTELVAKRCADWLAGPESARVRDAPAQLRRYFEQEKERSAANVTSIQGKLRAYNGSDAVAVPSVSSQSASKTDAPS